MSVQDRSLPIQFSCYFARSRAGEQFIAEHTIGYVVSGSVEMADENNKAIFKAGDLYFCRRNRLNKYTKIPGTGGDYRSVSIYFSQDVLRNFAIEYGYSADTQVTSSAFMPLATPSVLATYMESLRAYEQTLHQAGTEHLLAIKQKEALLLLLQMQPELKNILFDFSEPGKIDLEGFMNRNYHFNVSLERFAYLTGRSLSTFKRDFEKQFHQTPSRWLLQKRLAQAWHLIKEEKRSPSDIYLDLGFEDLSHFSFVFKKQYGVAPTMV